MKDQSSYLELRGKGRCGTSRSGVRLIAMAGLMAISATGFTASPTMARPATVPARQAVQQDFTVTVTPATEVSATVRWTAMPGAVEYLLQYRRVGTDDWVESYHDGTVTTVSAGGLNPGNWEFRVFAYDQDWNETLSSSAFLTMGAATQPLRASAVGEDGAALVTWNAQAGKINYYVQYRQVGTVAWQEAPYVDGDTTQYRVTGLSAGTWEFRVISYDAQWNHEISPSTATQVSAPGGLTVQQVINDMDLKDDVNWALAPGDSPDSCGDEDPSWACGPGWVSQSAMFGDAVADWVPEMYGKDASAPEFSSSKVWNEVRPWFVVFPSRQSTDTTINYSVKLRNYQTYVLRRSTGRWELIQSTDTGANEGMWGGIYDPRVGGQVGDTELSVDSEGTSFTPAAGKNALHGGPTDYPTVDNPGDVVALHTRVTARLTGADAANPGLKRLMNVGCDYGIPGESRNMYPGVGGSRLRLLTPAWQTYSFTTVKTPNAKVFNPINPERALKFSPDDLRRNPPPGVTP